MIEDVLENCSSQIVFEGLVQTDTELIATRKAVVEVMIEKFGTKNGPVNVSIQEKTFNGIADILSAAN